MLLPRRRHLLGVHPRMTTLGQVMFASRRRLSVCIIRGTSYANITSGIVALQRRLAISVRIPCSVAVFSGTDPKPLREKAASAPSQQSILNVSGGNAITAVSSTVLRLPLPAAAAATATAATTDCNYCYYHYYSSSCYCSYCY